MYEKIWRNEQRDSYEKNKEQVKSIQECIGKTKHKITYTYLSMFSYRDNKTYIYFLFVPFVTGMEKQWQLDKTEPWYQSYLFNYYPEKPFIYIKDDWMYCSDEFLKMIYDTKTGFAIYRYDDYTLKEIEMTYISNKPPHLRYVQSEATQEDTRTFEEWISDMENKPKITLEFQNPQEGSLFRSSFKGVTIKSGRYNFFEVIM